MLRKVNLYRTIVSGVIAALAFVIPVYLFIRDNTYINSWLLYVGSFLFMVVIWVHTMQENRKRREKESTVALVFISHMATIAGIIFSVLLSFILLSILVPGYFDHGNADQLMRQEPANVIKDKTDGLSFQVFFAATVINFSAGSFVGIILPFYAKRNQTRDPKDPSPFHHYGAK
jgi:hypothetical protein